MRHTQQGFTLAELLIALAILGVIATFTIPKILSSTGTAQLKTATKDAAGIIAGAYQDFSISTAVSNTTTFSNMLANINYVSNDQTATAATTGLQQDCAAGFPCLILHNGSIIQYSNDHAFGGSTNYITLKVDPDGSKSASTSDIVTIHLFFTGALRDRANIGSATSGGIGTALTAQSNASPTWATNLWQ